MTKEQAKQAVLKKYPGRQIGAIGDEGQHFIVTATDPKHKDEIDPFFAIDKKTGEITNYMPENLIEFGKMMGYAEDKDE